MKKRNSTIRTSETPPRAWGRLWRARWPSPVMRNTPTSVGKTAGRGCSRFSQRNTPTSVGKTARQGKANTYNKKHPHERGEDLVGTLKMEPKLETPPRAWGRLHGAETHCAMAGNTPTSVGKTRCPAARRSSRQKHPHERGEDPQGVAQPGLHLETPPRAWGRRGRAGSGRGARGNTPTSVGKTLLHSLSMRLSRKHPHERGEDHLLADTVVVKVETPPRAWGRPKSG